jgi:single-strand DNA-binding protein
MAKDFNQAIVMGNLTRDPELRSTPSGQSVASFAVATNRSWQDAAGEKRDDVQYHEIVAWGKLGELASNYLKKGRKVLVVGRLQTRTWEGNDGAKRQKTEIIANDINFVDKMSDSNGVDYSADNQQLASAEPKPAAKKEVVIEDMGEGDINLDDIPF